MTDWPLTPDPFTIEYLWIKSEMLRHLNHLDQQFCID